MGRFATAAEFYRYREPYPAEFFETVVSHLTLDGNTRLLDVACGPGNLAIGFAPFAGSCTAIDREPEMLGAARSAARKAKVEVNFIQTAVEDLPCVNEYDFVTIGRALHWLPRDTTLEVLERVVADGGRIAICGSIATDAAVNGWVAKYRETQESWASDRDRTPSNIDADAWFAGSRFRTMDEIAVTHRHRVTIPELIGRALSFSITCPAVIGQRRPEFEAALKATLEPFEQNGVLEEEVIAKATVLGTASMAL
jgi:SAM-dependent methyltransferase